MHPGLEVRLRPGRSPPESQQEPTVAAALCPRPQPRGERAVPRKGPMTLGGAAVLGSYPHTGLRVGPRPGLHAPSSLGFHIVGRTAELRPFLAALEDRKQPK